MQLIRVLMLPNTNVCAKREGKQ